MKQRYLLMKRYIGAFLFSCICVLSTAQEIPVPQTGKRILIPSPTPEQLLSIQNAGMDLHCGAKFEDGNLRLDLSAYEVSTINQLGLSYNVIEEDLTTFFANRAAATRAQAIQELEARQQEALLNQQEQQQQRSSLSTGTATIDSFIQREECDEVDWTSTNFRLGGFNDVDIPFGGCLTVDEMIIELDRMRMLFPNLISVRMDASVTPGNPAAQQTNGNTTGPASADFDPQTTWYVRISDNPDIDETNEPESLITGMSHAREVNSLMNVIYYMWWVLENYDTDPAIKNLVDNQEMYFVPIINPDGVKWNEKIAPNGGGLQRKNLRPGVADNGNVNTSNINRGVDLNRNFNYYWGFDNSGSSSTLASQTYRGPSPGSEPETEILQEFVQSRDFKYAINHHSGINSIVTSSYNGDPNATPSNREDEYQKLMHDATRFNRYIHGSAPNTLTAANGDTNDWMLGGPVVNYDPVGPLTSNPDTGSGKNIITFSPENGDDFWPATTDIEPIARRAVRMNLMTSLFAGKYARLHDFTPTNIESTNPEVDFAVEYLGQTASNLTLTITPVSTNILNVTQPNATALNGMDILEQRNTSATLTLNPSIAQNELIEYTVTLSNDTYIIYQVNHQKYYNPTEFLDADGADDWFLSGNWNGTTDGYDGSTNAITSTPTPPYANNELSFATLDYVLDLSGTSQVVLNFNAKWDIERNFDLAQLEASIDGGNTYTALCGKYTKVASGEQGNLHLNKSTSDEVHQSVNGNIVYDGDLILDPNITNTTSTADDVDKWVLEEVLLDATVNPGIVGNSDVRLRFRFDTDSSNRKDGYDTNFEGFTFDNFKVVGSNIVATRLCNGNLPVAVFPYSEGFNTTIGNWTQNAGDDGDWTVDGNGTGSGGTGPSGPAEGSDYIYLEASNPAQVADPNAIGFNATAIITSPCLDLTEFSSAQFSFQYHMFGAAMGSLDAQISTDGGTTWNSLLTTIFSGDMGNQWNTANIDISSDTGQIIQLRFVGITGNDFTSDMAIDDVQITASTLDYTFDNGIWTPENPSGVATCLDNITVLSGSPALTADTNSKDVTISVGATLDLASTTLNVCGNLTNTGSLLAADGSINMQGNTSQSIFGEPFEIGTFIIDNPTSVTLGGNVSINELLQLEQGNLISAGNLTLLSSATETAMIDEVTTASVTGDVTIERFIPARRAFRFLSSAVTTSTSINTNWQEGVNNTGIDFPTDNLNPNPGYGTHITGSDIGANGFDATPSGSPSLFIADNANQAFSPVTNTDSRTLTAGDPYLMLVRGGRDIEVINNSATPSNTRLRATGELFTGGLTITGSDLNQNAGEFNFIGNPYQASVDMNAVVAGSTNINTNQYYVWDPTLGVRGAYVTVLLTGSGSSNGAGSTANHYIQPGQAAFVTTASTVGDNSTAVSFNESDKVVGQNTNVFFDNQSSDENDPILNSAHIIGQLFHTDIYNAGGKLQDNFVLIFSPDDSNEITLKDAIKWFNQDENMGISNGDTTLSVERRFMPNESEEIQLFNNSYRTESYTMRILQEGLTTLTPYFVDTYTGNATPLEQGENIISFNVDPTVQGSVATNRFKISFAENTLSSDQTDGFTFGMYPNPLSSDVLTISSSTLAGQEVQVQVHNILGQLVLNATKNFSQTTNIEGFKKLENGIYFISLNTDNKTITKRLIIK